MNAGFRPHSDANRHIADAAFEPHPKIAAILATEYFAMWKNRLFAAGGLALLLAGASSSQAAGIAVGAGSISNAGSGTIVQRVHSLYEARHRLADSGYYDIQIERASLPYSFLACRRGTRYHLHVDYYGDIIQADQIGRCGGYGYGRRDYGDRPYFGNRWRFNRDRRDEY